ncbi:hypothetical protein ACFL4G_13250 [Thermodesulfobacteriota bacterium]
MGPMKYGWKKILLGFILALSCWVAFGASGCGSPETKIGIFYSLWHCPIAHGTIYDISEILAGHQGWGPVNAFHYWDRPQAGYYCLSENDALLASHAVQLRDAGIDFVFLDVTNHAYMGTGSDRTIEMIIEPFDRLLAIWAGIEGAPQVVPWVPVIEPDTNPNVNTVDALLQRLALVPGLHFHYLDKPLLLVTANAWLPPNEAKLVQLENNYTVRKMWGLYDSPGQEWSFLEKCKSDPTSIWPCNQRSAYRGVQIEQISITSAYQETYMSVDTATPKNYGKTFRKQFETLFKNPRAPIATITGWNEWIAQRQPCDHTPACSCAEHPDGCFVDAYDIEYNRDIEPGVNEMGDYYYRLMKSCIEIFRRGETCGDPDNGDELCCMD